MTIMGLSWLKLAKPAEHGWRTTLFAAARRHPYGAGLMIPLCGQEPLRGQGLFQKKRCKSGITTAQWHPAGHLTGPGPAEPVRG
jgi:hypothetical protein